MPIWRSEGSPARRNNQTQLLLLYYMIGHMVTTGTRHFIITYRDAAYNLKRERPLSSEGCATLRQSRVAHWRLPTMETIPVKHSLSEPLIFDFELSNAIIRVNELCFSLLRTHLGHERRRGRAAAPAQ
jgi:hypothetical protein